MATELLRRRCSPGKVYTIGPGETMQNFEVHLKNKRHHEKVAERLRSAPA